MRIRPSDEPTPESLVVQILKSHRDYSKDWGHDVWRLCYRVGTSGMWSDTLSSASTEEEAFANLVRILSMAERVDPSVISVERLEE